MFTHPGQQALVTINRSGWSVDEIPNVDRWQNDQTTLTAHIANIRTRIRAKRVGGELLFQGT
jgi:hypothetical protein